MCDIRRSATIGARRAKGLGGRRIKGDKVASLFLHQIIDFAP